MFLLFETHSDITYHCNERQSKKWQPNSVVRPFSYVFPDFVLVFLFVVIIAVPSGEFLSLLFSWHHAHYLHCRNSLALISVFCCFCFFVKILYANVMMTSTIILGKNLKSRVFKISTNKWTPFICRDFGFWFFCSKDQNLYK